MKMNKIVKSAFALPLLAVALIGCDPTTNELFNNKEASVLDSLDYSSIGGIGLLDSSISSVSNIKAPLSAKYNSELSEKTKQSILMNLEIAENSLNGDIVKSEVTKSPNPEYEFYHTLTATDITGEEKVYSFYYNSAVREEKDYDDGILEVEREERLDGIITLDGTTYKMIGNKSTEGDEEEVTFKIMIDNSNYVVIEQETESNEKEFEYTTYQNGRKVYESSVSYEVDRNGRVELEFELEENGTKLEYKYEFYEANGNSYVEVKVENNNSYQRILIQIFVDSNGNKTYEFVS